MVIVVVLNNFNRNAAKHRNRSSHLNKIKGIFCFVYYFFSFQRFFFFICNLSLLLYTRLAAIFFSASSLSSHCQIDFLIVLPHNVIINFSDDSLLFYTVMPMRKKIKEHYKQLPLFQFNRILNDESDDAPRTKLKGKKKTIARNSRDGVLFLFYFLLSTSFCCCCFICD